MSCCWWNLEGVPTAQSGYADLKTNSLIAGMRAGADSIRDMSILITASGPQGDGYNVCSLLRTINALQSPATVHVRPRPPTGAVASRFFAALSGGTSRRASDRRDPQTRPRSSSFSPTRCASPLDSSPQIWGFSRKHARNPGFGRVVSACDHYPSGHPELDGQAPCPHERFSRLRMPA